MTTGEPARRIGFRRWHERELYRGFAWFAASLLSGIALAAILEGVGLRTAGPVLVATLAALYLVGLLAIASFRRFWAILTRAQRCAEHATCGQCGAYGLFDVQPAASWFPAVCRRCGHRWTVS